MELAPVHVRLSLPSPSSVCPLDVYPWETHKHLKFNKDLPLFVGNGSSSHPLLESESPLFCSPLSPGPAQAGVCRSWPVPATRAQLHIHRGSLKSASMGVYTHRNQQTLQMRFLPGPRESGVKHFPAHPSADCSSQKSLRVFLHFLPSAHLLSGQ